MDAELYGDISRAVIAVIGTWDPFLPKHQHLLQHLRQYAERVSLQPLVIMLDPAPQSLAFGNIPTWPVYDAPDVRLALMRTCGIEAVLVVRFAEPDLDSSINEFFRLICKCSKIDELVLGANQIFGRGRDSTPEALMSIAKRRKIHLLRLPLESSPDLGRQVRELIADGRLRKAARVVGHPPVWNKPVRGHLKLAWPEGLYDCAPVNHPFEKPPRLRHRVEMTLQKNGYAKMRWPDSSVKWLAFTAGPSDI